MGSVFRAFGPRGPGHSFRHLSLSFSKAPLPLSIPTKTPKKIIPITTGYGNSNSNSSLVVPKQNMSVHFDPTAKPPSGWIPKSKYGGWCGATLLPGGGIGPELMEYVVQTFEYCGIPVVFESINVVDDEADEDTNGLHEAICSIKRNGVALKGNIETRSLDPSIVSRNLTLRNELDLYVYLLHCRSYEGIRSRHQNVDVFILRQNTEGEYSNMEHEALPGIIESIKLITAKNSERIARYAFEFAKRVGRKKVTTIHKANIMKFSDGLFLEVSREVAKEYPDIEHNDMIIDNCCMQLVSNPSQFDIMLMPNLYGGIISNVLCGLIGGAGLLSACNYGTEYAVFEPAARNTGSKIAGKNRANPISMLNASVDLLRHVGLDNHSKLIQAAIHNTLCVEKIYTQDLGGTHTSSDVMSSILKYVKTHEIGIKD